MNILRYDDAAASAAHEGSIRAYEVIPESIMPAPFSSAWGYLAGPGRLASHAHPTDEIYMIFKGEGVVTVGEESQSVVPGDIVVIPHDTEHSILNAGPGELLWCAFWWPQIQP